MAQPIISVIMANYNASDYIEAALKSVLVQSVQELELIVTDDASTDRSVALVRDIAATDTRLRILEANTNLGPAAARNRALDIARGKWVAIVDSDDIIHPRRLEFLLAAAERLATDAVADDLTYFTDSAIGADSTLLGNGRPAEAMQLTANSFVSAAPTAPQLGYLKPVFRRSALGNLRYREDIRIGEDHDFYMRFLLEGGSMHLLSASYYLYRRHSQSLSHRLHPNDIRAMIDLQDNLLTQYPDVPLELRANFAARRAALQEPLAFETLVQNLKNYRFAHALMNVVHKPALLKKLGSVALSHVMRRVNKPSARPSTLASDLEDWTLQRSSGSQSPETL